MKKLVNLYLEQDEIHKIIKKYFELGDVEMGSDTNAGITTFTYKTKEEALK